MTLPSVQVMAMVDIITFQQIPGYFDETIETTIAFLPRLVGAIIILLVGWIVGRLIGRIVRRLVATVRIDRATMRTPIGEMLGGPDAVSRAFGIVAAWYVYFLAFLAAANVLAIQMLSEWIDAAVSYLPAFVAGVLIIVFGFILADFVGDVIQRSITATRARTSALLADGTRIFLYFVVLVVGLETMGVNVGILYIFAGAAAFGLALAIAIGAGLAIGFGGRGYVDDNIDRWMRQARRTATSASRDDPDTGPTTADD